MSEPDEHMKKALEDKRKKLELLKQKREERRKLKEVAENERVAKEKKLHELQEHQQSSYPASSPSATGGTFFEANAASVLNSVNAILGDNPKTAPPELPANPADPNSKSGVVERHTVTLEVLREPVHTDIAPRETQTYDREIQVDLGGGSLSGPAEAEREDPEAEQQRLDELRERKRREREQQQMEEKLNKEREAEAQERNKLSSEQKKEIMESGDFKSFFARSSAIIERTLYQNARFDVAVDYSAAQGADGKENESGLSNRLDFFDKGKTLNRPVTSISWSPQHKELVLASYAKKTQKDSLSMEPDGLVLVWSTELPTRPEYTFSCQSTVLSAQFHPSDPKLVIGSTQSGQLVIWDTRDKRTPVNRTSLSQGHTHPVYALAALPSVNLLHHIISVSTDGMLCVWNDNDLMEPTTKLDLKWEKNEVTTTCLSFPGRDTNKVVLGSDEGIVYNAQIHDSPGIRSSIQAHAAPISQIAFHPSDKNEHKEFSDLFLTASFDWTAKLWSSKTDKLLFSFESARDYIYDIAWSPGNPALFATGDGAGGIDFWDLARDTEVPIKRAQIFHEEKESIEKRRAVSRLSWNDEGNKIAVGGSDGSLMIYDVDEKVCKPTAETQDNFYKAIRKASAV